MNPLHDAKSCSEALLLRQALEQKILEETLGFALTKVDEARKSALAAEDTR